MSVLVELCLVGALFGLGYISLGSEAATAHALEDGLLEQKRDSGSSSDSSRMGGARRNVQNLQMRDRMTHGADDNL